MIVQVAAEDVRAEDLIWSIHDEKFLQVFNVSEISACSIRLDFGMYGRIETERGHLFFRDVQEEWYVAMDECGAPAALCGPFMSEIQAEEYITNIKDTVACLMDEEFGSVQLVSPEQFLRDMVSIDEKY